MNVKLSTKDKIKMILLNPVMILRYVFGFEFPDNLPIIPKELSEHTEDDWFFMMSDEYKEPSKYYMCMYRWFDLMVPLEEYSELLDTLFEVYGIEIKDEDYRWILSPYDPRFAVMDENSMENLKDIIYVIGADIMRLHTEICRKGGVSRNETFELEEEENLKALAELQPLVKNGTATKDQMLRFLEIVCCDAWNNKTLEENDYLLLRTMAGQEEGTEEIPAVADQLVLHMVQMVKHFASVFYYPEEVNPLIGEICDPVIEGDDYVYQGHYRIAHKLEPYYTAEELERMEAEEEVIEAEVEEVTEEEVEEVEEEEVEIPQITFEEVPDGEEIPIQFADDEEEDDEEEDDEEEEDDRDFDEIMNQLQDLMGDIEEIVEASNEELDEDYDDEEDYDEEDEDYEEDEDEDTMKGGDADGEETEEEDEEIPEESQEVSDNDIGDCESSDDRSEREEDGIEPIPFEMKQKGITFKPIQNKIAPYDYYSTSPQKIMTEEMILEELEEEDMDPVKKTKPVVYVNPDDVKELIGVPKKHKKKLDVPKEKNKAQKDMTEEIVFDVLQKDLEQETFDVEKMKKERKKEEEKEIKELTKNVNKFDKSQGVNLKHPEPAPLESHQFYTELHAYRYEIAKMYCTINRVNEKNYVMYNTIYGNVVNKLHVDKKVRKKSDWFDDFRYDPKDMHFRMQFLSRVLLDVCNNFERIVMAYAEIKKMPAHDPYSRMREYMQKIMNKITELSEHIMNDEDCYRELMYLIKIEAVSTTIINYGKETANMTKKQKKKPVEPTTKKQVKEKKEVLDDYMPTIMASAQRYYEKPKFSLFRFFMPKMHKLTDRELLHITCKLVYLTCTNNMVDDEMIPEIAEKFSFDDYEEKKAVVSALGYLIRKSRKKYGLTIAFRSFINSKPDLDTIFEGVDVNNKDLLYGVVGMKFFMFLCDSPSITRLITDIVG